MVELTRGQAIELRAERERDKAFVARFLDGDMLARREMATLNAIIAEVEVPPPPPLVIEGA